MKDCLLNDSQYDGVLGLLKVKMKKYKKPVLKLHKIYETICRQAVESYLPEPTYTEFRSMFMSNFVDVPMFPEKSFTLEQSYFLDVKKKYPADDFSVHIKKATGKSKKVVH